MSTSRITKRLPKSALAPDLLMQREAPLTVPLKIASDLRSKLASSPLSANIKIFDDQAQVSINQLSYVFSRIKACHRENMADEEKILLEKYKLSIMQSVHDYITKNNKTKLEENEAKQSGIIFWIKMILMSPVLLINLVQMSIFIFLGIRETLLSIFSKLSNPALILISLAVTAIQAVQFASFEVQQIKNLLGISFSQNIIDLLKTHLEQVKLLKKINTALDSTTMRYNLGGDEIADKFIPITCQFNEDIRQKKTDYNNVENNQHTVKKRLIDILKIGFAAFNVLMNLTGAYYGSLLLLKTVAAALIGTPIGWAIIGTVIVCSLIMTIATYYTIRGDSIASLINPTLNEFKEVKEKLDKFTPKDTANFNFSLAKQNAEAMDNSLDDSKNAASTAAVTPEENFQPTLSPSINQ